MLLSAQSSDSQSSHSDGLGRTTLYVGTALFFLNVHAQSTWWQAAPLGALYVALRLYFASASTAGHRDAGVLFASACVALLGLSVQQRLSVQHEPTTDDSRRRASLFSAVGGAPRNQFQF